MIGGEEDVGLVGDAQLVELLQNHPEREIQVQRRRCLHRPLAFVAAVGDGCAVIVESVAGGNVAGFIAHEHISPRPRRLHVQVRHLLQKELQRNGLAN